MRLVIETLRTRKGDTAEDTGSVVIPLADPAEVPAVGDLICLNERQHEVTRRTWSYDGQVLIECRVRVIEL